MANYVKLAATAKRLIELNGRTVTLVRKTRAPADAAKPWRGPSGTGNTVVASPKAVIYPATEKNEDGTLVSRGFEKAMVAHDSISPAQDLSDIDSIIDGSVTYKVIKAYRIGPGDVVIHYEFDLKR
jgi:hypothetical protein